MVLLLFLKLRSFLLGYFWLNVAPDHNEKTGGGGWGWYCPFCRRSFSHTVGGMFHLIMIDKTGGGVGCVCVLVGDGGGVLSFLSQASFVPSRILLVECST